MWLSISYFLLLFALPPFEVGFAGLIFLVPVFFDIQNRSNIHTFLTGSLLGAFVSTYVFWGTQSYSTVALLFVVTTITVTMGLFLSVCRKALPQPLQYSIPLISGFWLLIEVLFSYLHIPFSYAILLSGTPALIQPASYGGQILVSLLAIALQVSMYHLFHMRQTKHGFSGKIILPTVICMIFITSYLGNYTQSNNGTEKISIVVLQTNTPPSTTLEISAQDKLEKFHTLRKEFLDKIGKLPSRPDLVLWPEVSLSRFEFRNHINMANEARIRGLAMLVASPDLDPSGTLTNAVFSISATGEILHKHTKTILIPFIEHDIRAEHTIAPHSELPGTPGSLICFESAFSEPAIQLSRSGAGIITISTNDAYAGPSLLPLIHHLLARIRAVENQKMVVRAANGGPSSIIDPMGNTLRASELFIQDIIHFRIKAIYSKSFYAEHYFLLQSIYHAASLVVLIYLFLGNPRSVKEQRDVRMPSSLSHNILLTAGCGMAFCTFQANLISNLYLQNDPHTSLAAFENSQQNHDIKSNLAYLKATSTSMTLYSSASYLLREHGVIPHSISTLNPGHNDPTETRHWRVFREIATSHGYESVTEKYILSQDGLPTPYTPSIALLDTGEAIVIKSYQKSAVIFFSPSEGKVIAVSREAFEKKWNGEIMHFRPGRRHWDHDNEPGQS